MASTRQVTGSFQFSTSLTYKNLFTSGKSASSGVGPGSITIPQVEAGIQANEANRAWDLCDKVLAAGSDFEIDVNDFAGLDIGGGVGKDALGQDLDVQNIMSFLVHSISGEGKLEIYPSPASGWTPVGEHREADGGALCANGILWKFAPYEGGLDVQPGTSEKVTFKALDAAMTFSISIIGRNDDEDSSSSTSSSSFSSSSSSSSSSSVSSSSSSEST